MSTGRKLLSKSATTLILEVLYWCLACLLNFQSQYDLGCKQQIVPNRESINTHLQRVMALSVTCNLALTETFMQFMVQPAQLHRRYRGCNEIPNNYYVFIHKIQSSLIVIIIFLSCTLVSHITQTNYISTLLLKGLLTCILIYCDFN